MRVVVHAPFRQQTSGKPRLHAVAIAESAVRGGVQLVNFC